MLEAGTERAGVEITALVLGQALGPPEPVRVQQGRGLATAPDGEPALEVQLDEAVADPQDAELLELRRGVQRGRGLDVVRGGQRYPAGSSAESVSSAVDSTSAGASRSNPAAR
jgi:hypothetical protein